jgi:hypothetical protein
VNAQNFTANANFQVACYSGGSQLPGSPTPYRSNLTQLRFDGSGNFNGDVACWDGFGNNDYVVIEGVTSNTTNWGVVAH